MQIDRGTQVFLAVLLAVSVAVPVMHLAFPDGSALHLSTYTMTLIGKYMTYALLAIAVDLVWGYCGILSLGHAAFFALGGYAMGMYLMRQIGIPDGIGAVGYTESDVDSLVEGTLKQQRLLATAPREATADDLSGILRESVSLW